MNPKRLKRELKLHHMFTLAFGATVGVGWITMLGLWITQAGSIGAVIAFLIGGIFVLLIAVCYGELSSMYAASGGEIVYAYKAFGQFGGFLVGWLAIFIYGAVMAFLSVSLGWIVSVLLGDSDAHILYNAFGYDVTFRDLLLTQGGLLVLVLVNVSGARASARFQDFVTFLLVFVSVGFIGLGLLHGDLANLSPSFVSADILQSLRGIAIVLIATPLWFAGFNVVVQAIGERAESVSPKKVAAAMLLGIVSIMLFYVLLIVSASMSLPRDQLLQLELPAAEGFAVAFGLPMLRQVVLAAGVLGVVTSWNAVLFAGARALFAMGRAHLLPHRFANVHSKYGTPHCAIIFIGVISSAASFLGLGAIQRIVNASGIAFGLLFMAVALSLIELRYRLPDQPRPFRAPIGTVLASGAALAAAAIVTFSIWSTKPPSGAVALEWLLIIIWLLGGLAVWVLSTKSRLAITEEQRNRLILGHDLH
jgi:amino acid transporter